MVHLSTQALITTYSKAPFYDLEKASFESPLESGRRDEIGLVRAIAVKVCIIVSIT